MVSTLVFLHLSTYTVAVMWHDIIMKIYRGATTIKATIDIDTIYIDADNRYQSKEIDDCAISYIGNYCNVW